MLAKCFFYGFQNIFIHRLQYSTLTAEPISSAKIAGMTDDLKLVGSDYQWLLTIFYITYIIFEFQTLMWRIVLPQYAFSKNESSSASEATSRYFCIEQWLLQTLPIA